MGEWVLDLEISLVERWGWSLRDIDETDIESLLPFIYRFAATTGKDGKPKAKAPGKKTFIDQINFP